MSYKNNSTKNYVMTNYFAFSYFIIDESRTDKMTIFEMWNGYFQHILYSLFLYRK